MFSNVVHIYFFTLFFLVIIPNPTLVCLPIPIKSGKDRLLLNCMSIHCNGTRLYLTLRMFSIAVMETSIVDVMFISSPLARDNIFPMRIFSSIFICSMRLVVSV